MYADQGILTVQKTYIYVHLIIKQNRLNNGTIQNFKTSNVIKLMCSLSFSEWQHTRRGFVVIIVFP